MLMLAAATVVLWQAGTMNDMSRCRTVREGKIGPEATWGTDGKGWLWLSTTARASGRVELQCRIRVSTAIRIRLELGSAVVSFAGAQTRETGSGLRVTAPNVRWELLRVAGEDWVETTGRQALTEPESTELLLIIAAIDGSTSDPMRIDIRGLRLVTADGR